MIKTGDRVRVRDGVVDATGHLLGHRAACYAVVHLDGDVYPRKVTWSEVSKEADAGPMVLTRLAPLLSGASEELVRGAGLDKTSR